MMSTAYSAVDKGDIVLAVAGSRDIADTVALRAVMHIHVVTEMAAAVVETAAG